MSQAAVTSPAQRPSSTTAAPSIDRIGILAGGGRLPVIIAESVMARGGHVHIVGIEGEADQDIVRFPHTWANWAQIDRMVAALRSEGGNELVIAGGVRRPDLWKLRPDAGFFRSLPQIAGLLVGGDDSVLSRVVRFFEAKGLTVRGAHEVAPDLLAQPGPLGAVALTPQSRIDAELGFSVRAALGPLDAGQAVAVVHGRVLAIEGAEGTDAMLERVAALRRATDAARVAGVLAKGPKPGQELRVDMPVIGPRTVETAAAAGLAGVAVEAGAVLVLGREEAVRAADARQFAIEGLAGSLSGKASTVFLAHRVGRLMSRHHPNERDRVDVQTGLAAIERLAPFQTGSAVVVARSYILALAADETALAMLDRVRALRQWGMRGRRRRGVLVCRAEEPGDPAVIQQMCEHAARQGLAGLAVAGPADALAPYEDASRVADMHGLFLVACHTGNEG
ncbi:MAG: UDP-2,3-diacylglucosamine diphosphatase LpxI [Hyphomonadaceae bacterium]|nr:UDP-2,3-diacylglucosamine diphosphatase LpxI [Hyphomonadaceae bacterium]